MGRLNHSDPESQQKRATGSQAGETRLIELAGDPDDEEVTIYVKGFLGRGESPRHFTAWLGGHPRQRHKRHAEHHAGARRYL